MQHALLKEKRAYETCERLRAQCKTQASLMCRLFASKLQEQQAICARAISAPPGERAQVQAEADAFGASTRWILEEAAAAGLAQARDKEVEALREENETLRKKVSELETKLVDNNAIIIEPEEPQSSLLMRRLEDERDKCRDEARAARGRVLELEGGMNARQAVDGEVAALRREVASLRASNGHTDPDEIKRLKKEHKDALKKAKAALKAGGSSSEAEKEELMAAMEREVEQVVGEERARFDKERSRLEKELRKAKKGSKASGQQLSVLRDQVRAAKTEIQAAKQDAKRILKELPQLAKQTCQTLMKQCGNMAHEVQEAKRKYHKELAERKRLHNLVQELRGNIRVYCRVRPVSRRELENGGDEGCRQCVQFPEDGLSVEVRSAKKEKTFEYDQVFACDSTQEKVYSEIADLVVSVLDGYNVCIFAYGQTGSGKTYTMNGPPENRGCNLRALHDLFVKSKERRRDAIEDVITVSVLEIYNESIRDLLRDPSKGLKKLEVRRGERGNYVPDLTTVEVHDDAEVLELMDMADSVRAAASTDMNEHSSRSHMLLSVHVATLHKSSGMRTFSKLHLVDLAGSERINKSNATGQALKEAQNINKSLSALGDVIAARGADQKHVPFRNSTLTHLLQDSISQDSKTLMFCCISPVTYNVDETFCTLNFASRVGNVELGKASKQVVGGSKGRR
jgi:kinesin family protein C2/C3